MLCWSYILSISTQRCDGAMTFARYTFEPWDQRKQRQSDGRVYLWLVFPTTWNQMLEYQQ